MNDWIPLVNGRQNNAYNTYNGKFNIFRIQVCIFTIKNK